jgi:hypothetical protein
VDVAHAVGSAAREELVPVSRRGLVRADLGRGDGQLELDPDPGERCLEEVRVGVREHGEPPAAVARLLERRRHLGKRVPLRQRALERVLLAGGSAETRERDGHHVAIATTRILALDLRLELVVGVEELAAARSAEQPLELAPDAAVPVDQRAVAVEGRPAVHAGNLSRRRATARTA